MLFPPSEAQQEHRLFSSVWGICGPRLRGAHGGCFARSVGRGQSAAERFQAHADCARNFDSSDSELDWVDCSGGVLARVPAAGVCISNGALLYFNVSYARNMLTLVDPSHRAWSFDSSGFTSTCVGKCASSTLQYRPGRKQLGRAAPVSLPLAALVVMGLLLQVARKQYLMLLYVILSLGVVCLTPFPGAVRTVSPASPLSVLCSSYVSVSYCCGAGTQISFASVSRFCSFAPGLARHMCHCGTELMALRRLYGLKYHDVAYEHVGKFIKYRLFFYYPVGTGFDEALDWLKRRAERTDVIANLRSDGYI